MKRVLKLVSVSLVAILLLSSCVTKKQLFDSHYFQALGSDEAIVVTFNAKKEALDFLNLEDTTVGPLLERLERLSVELYKDYYDYSNEFITETDLKEYNYRGAIEGKFPKLITNTVLLKDSTWEKVEYDNGLRSYRNDQLALEAYAARRNLLLFTNDNYVDLYQSTVKNREVKIDLALAEQMASALFGFYFATPQAMIDIGLPIPKSALLQCESIMLYVNYAFPEKFLLGATITLKNERLANSLSILLKSSYISEKRRNKEPLGDLTDLFNLVDNTVVIKNLELSEKDYKQISSLFNNLSYLF